MRAARAKHASRRILSALPGLLILCAAPAAQAQFVEDDVTVLYTLEGVDPAETFGWAVAELPDIDGDAVMDFIVGAPFYDVGAGPVGRALIYSGARGALLHELIGEVGGDQLGFAMARLDDTNGDGIADFALSAPGASGNIGAVYLYSGADGTQLHVLNGEAAGDRFGTAVGHAGDVNNDARGDVIVGAPGNDAMGDLSGRAYVFSGADGALLHTIEAETDGDRLGTGAAFAGDINGDNIPDQILGARDAGADGKGLAYVVSGLDGSVLLPPLAPDPSGVDFGFFFVATVGDATGDGVPDLYVGDFADGALGQASGKAYLFSGADGATLHVFAGSAAMEGMGPGRGAGDINGDGRADVVACSWTSSEGAASAGKLHLFSGSDGALLRTITSTTEGETLGFDAVGIGDVNGDGAPDLLAAAGSASRVYVIAGNAAEGGAGGAGGGSGGSGGSPGPGTGTGTGTSGSGGNSGTPGDDPGSSSGCGCRTAPSPGGAAAALAAVFAGLIAARARRRTRAHARVR